MKVRRCPMCHRVSEPLAWQCHCGYEFGQSSDKALELLRSQRRNARLNLGLLLGIDALAVAWLVVSILAGSVFFSGLIFGFLAVQTGRTIHKLAITRESIGQLEARALPKAQLRRG